jgi:hypothetical protein
MVEPSRIRRKPVQKALRLMLGLTAAFALAACAVSAMAATKDFSATIAPGTVPAGRLVDMTATLTNAASQQQLGSANLTPPSGFTAVSVTSLSRPAPASAAIAGGVVQLRNLSLPSQGSVTVALKVSTPCSVGANPTWVVVAKQANDFSGLPGNNLTLDTAASSLSTTTTGACAPCPENESCNTSLGGPTGSQSAVKSDPSATLTDSGVLTISVVAPMDCAGYAERSQDTFQVDAPPNRPKSGSLTYAATTRPITAKDPLEVCYGSPTLFAPKPKTQLTTAIFDGVLHYVGRLPNCTGSVPPPCVTARDNTSRTITFTMPTGDPRNM